MSFADSYPRTTYLGKHRISAKNLVGSSHGDELLHVFFSEFSFLDFEETFTKKGGAFGSKTLYLIREKLAGEEDDEEETD